MDPIFPAACGAAAAATGCYLSSAARLHFSCCYSAPVALLLLIQFLHKFVFEDLYDFEKIIVSFLKMFTLSHLGICKANT